MPGARPKVDHTRLLIYISRDAVPVRQQRNALPGNPASILGLGVPELNNCCSKVNWCRNWTR